MKLTMFQAGKGDCLLLRSRNGKTMLIDGGKSKEYRNHVRRTLGNLAANDQLLDLVYVSHIDDDHIAGVLTLMEDSIAWRRFDYQRATGNTEMREPRFPRPPAIKALWHNAFKAQVDDNEGAIENQLVANARIFSTDLSFAEDLQSKVTNLRDTYNNLGTSVKQGLQLTRRAVSQLRVDINPPTAGRLISVEAVPEVENLGELDIYIIGPFEEDLNNLRKRWNKWLQANQQVVEEVEAEIEADMEAFAGLMVMDEGQRLSSILFSLAAVLGDRKAVTPPNLASLMLLVEEGEEEKKRILLTGDGHAADIVKGLEAHEKLDPQGRLHVDILKVQHHGSKNNITAEFCEKITADHYLFCGNGDHHNPHLDVIDTLVNTRSSLPEDHPQAGKAFKLWFNSSPQVVSTEKRRKHMEDVGIKVAGHAAKNDLVKFKFLDRGSKLEINLE
jgi:beta-lactamase superfamily II metal-dependent hydrolase